MTLISKVNWKKHKKNELPKDWFKEIWFMDQVYVIRKPEVFNGWVCEIIEIDHSSRTKFGFGYPLVRTSDGEFVHVFDGNNPNFEVEYLGKL